MDFLGNISLRLVGLVVTVGTLAAIYFFVIRPDTDTAESPLRSISGPLRQAERLAVRAQRQLRHNAATGGGTSSKIDLNKLQKCLSGAGREVRLLERCAKRFGP